MHGDPVAGLPRLNPGRLLNAKLSATESPTLFATVQNTHDIIRLARIPVSEARPDHATGRRAASATDLVSVDEEEWQSA
jgi:hypothetical protein